MRKSQCQPLAHSVLTALTWAIMWPSPRAACTSSSLCSYQLSPKSLSPDLHLPSTLPALFPAGHQAQCNPLVLSPHGHTVCSFGTMSPHFLPDTCYPVIVPLFPPLEVGLSRAWEPGVDLAKGTRGPGGRGSNSSSRMVSY